ncbi:hypothetical protein SSABA_v1c00630 [Spiroplasma sabaudiense Ar-1343]|uniref:Folate family ECF transporter S component n=1 Tax=Spiroplasma sabaudiense Ar-1343 TaxID=1276257 RepID=W6A9A8_9MOLU|nr:folate family ECF transporter S component [Spiroplasma sabaudiense]AHI53475.1 hypothetical protein SSABA_v1c00630 [Spiroplasma sabaudiense Ar-1343]
MLYLWTNLAAALGIFILFILAFFMEGWSFKKLNIKTISVISLLTAMSVVLTNFIGYSFPLFGGTVILAFGDWILFLTGLTFGPLAGVIVGICVDLTGSLIQISGTFHLGFMLIKVMLGFGGALIFYFRTNNFIYLKILLIYGIIYTITSLLLNPIWLYASGWGEAVFVNFVFKLIKLPFGIAIYPLLTYFSFITVTKLVNDWDPYQVWCFRKGKIDFFGKISKESTSIKVEKQENEHEQIEN